MRLRDTSVELFKILSTDEELLDLLEVPIIDKKDGKYIRRMEDIKTQIQETKSPYDLIMNEKSRICVYEATSSHGFSSVVERCFVKVDIYVHKKKDEEDRRILKIADRVYKILHRAKVFDYEIRFYNKTPNKITNDKQWGNFGMVFFYDNLIL